MADARGTLNTRWSMLDGLRGQSAEDAWRWFIDRYRTYIVTCLERLIEPRDRAVQAAEEIWGYLFTSSMIKNADKSRRFRSYLAGTVRNFALNWLRRNSADASLSQCEEPATAEDSATQFEEEELRLWKAQVVQLALVELSMKHSDQARAIRWFYGLPESVNGGPGENRSASWIAEQLGIKANAVHQVVFRGRKRLRSCIENELRETVGNKDDLDDEMRLIYEVIEEENPGLGQAG